MEGLEWKDQVGREGIWRETAKIKDHVMGSVET